MKLNWKRKKTILVLAFSLAVLAACSNSEGKRDTQPGTQSPTPGPTATVAPFPTNEPGVNLLKRSDLVILSGDVEARTDSYKKNLMTQTKALLDGWLYPKINTLGIITRTLARSKVSNMEPFIDPVYRDEMTILSKKISVDYQDILLGNAASDLGQLVTEWNFFGCSTFAVLPTRSATGSMIVGRNLDYTDSQIIRSYWVPVLFEVPGKLRFLSIHAPGMTGVLTGVNEKGVMISIKVSRGETTSEGTPSAFIFRKILETANTADEAVSIYAAQKRTVALNIQISDPQKAIELEIDAKNYAQLVASPAGIVYGANHFDSDKMRNNEKSRDFRWPILSAHETTTNKLSFEDVRTVIADAAGLDPEPIKRLDKNILAVFVVYNSDLKETAVYYGSDPERNGISARGILKKIKFSELFP